MRHYALIHAGHYAGALEAVCHWLDKSLPFSELTPVISSVFSFSVVVGASFLSPSFHSLYLHFSRNTLSPTFLTPTFLRPQTHGVKIRRRFTAPIVGPSPLRVLWNGTRFHTHSGTLLGVPTASDRL